MNALVSRSKCYLLLGESEKALNDAEVALLNDKNNIRAIYQKAESLYFLGQFEHSLMFFHRGLRLRPEMKSFRLGVQKTQEAIENTIGVTQSMTKAAAASKSPKDSGAPNTGASRVSTGRTTTTSRHQPQPQTATTSSNQPRRRPMTSKADCEKKPSRLCVDKDYLEGLLKHPELKEADQIATIAKDAVNFLNNREEFWRQQQPCNMMRKGSRKGH